MKNYPKKVRKILHSIISDMAKNPWLYAKHPGKDFTRKRKLPFEKTISTLICMGGGTLNKELLEQFKFDPSIATSSAFLQQRDKLLPEALDYLLHEFTRTAARPKTYHNYRLLAVDGSDIQIPTDPSDPKTYFPPAPTRWEMNLLHIDAMYDLCSNLYVDTIVRGKRGFSEYSALIKMIDRWDSDDPAIIIADRGYESYNVFAHIQEKGCYFLIRIKDIGSPGIIAATKVPNTDEFDIFNDLLLTRKQTNKVKKLFKENPEKYRYISSGSPFDFLDLHTKLFYSMQFRIVRFQIAPGVYEAVATNLPTAQFPPDEIKKLYHMRWGIETSFRHLKHTLGLLNFHSQKTEYIIQEIYAKMIMYNFCEMITSHVVIQERNRKYRYQVNFSAAVLICRQFLRQLVTPSSVESLIRKYITAVVPERSRPRYRQREFRIRFVYRIA